MVEPERWSEPVDLSQLSAPASAACVFGGSETSVTLLTSTPGVPGQNVIDNADIAAAREIIDRYTGTGRVLGHTIVHPNIGPSELEAMETWHDELKPAAGRSTRCGIRPIIPDGAGPSTTSDGVCRSSSA